MHPPVQPRTLSFLTALILSGCQELYLDKDRNDAPSIEIVAPTPSDAYRSGETVSFRAVPTDSDDDLELLMVTWYLDDMVLCEGAPPDADGNSTCELTFTQGMTSLMAEVRDPANAVGTDTRIFEVLAANEPPTCAIVFPTSEPTVEAQALVTLLGSGDDPDGDPDSLTARWLSDLDGELGTSTVGADGLLSFSTASLSEGSHVITLEVTDALEGRCTVDEPLEVGLAPVVEILTPEPASTFTLDDAVPWTASVSDDTTAAPDLALEWTSSLDGALSTPVADSTGSAAGSWLLSEGSHTLTLTAVDEAGRSASDSVDVVVEACNPNAPEVPYDGIDSNCDGLEQLNDANGDNIPDDSIDYDVDDDFDTSDAIDVPPRLGIECVGDVVTSTDGRSFYLLTCDDDRYWNEAEMFCQDIGYTSLGAHHDLSMLEQHTAMVEDIQARNEAAKLAGALHEDIRAEDPWLALTRGPGCAPATSGSTHPEICTNDVRAYYWTDTTIDPLWLQDDISAAWHDCELADCGTGTVYLNPASGDYTMHNSVEHCAFLLVDDRDAGYFDLYCELVSGFHEDWSRSHTRASSCIREITP